MAPVRSSLRVACSALLALLGAGLLGGCVTSGTRIQAKVAMADPACGAPAAAPQPLAGASVAMMCPQVIKASGASIFGRTDARGELDFKEPVFGRWIHDGCEIIVERPGFEEARFPVAQVCAEYEGNHCIRAVIHAELVRTDIPPRRCP